MKNRLAVAQVCALVQRKATLALCLALCTIGLGLSAGAQGSRIITFDPPGAGRGSGQGTIVAGINALGVIAGYYLDANNVYHGFLRSPDGKFTTFDAPGADTMAGDFNGTLVLGLNPQGATVGHYIDAQNVNHAYIRSPGGKFTTFAAPGACTTSLDVGCHGTGAWNINLVGTSVGPYEDTSGNFVAHTFIRSSDGKFTTFAVPGSSMEAGQGTLPGTFSGLNQLGAITGLYYDANNAFHGFLRSPNGKFATFEAPGADTTISFNGTFPNSLNDFGAITGYDLDVNEVVHGFVRSPDGKFTTFDAPGADTTAGDFNGTFPLSINPFGAITGNEYDANGVSHGFVRGVDGKFATFDAPGADMNAGDFNGTFPVSNNPEGAITGYYIDANNVSHGFIRMP